MKFNLHGMLQPGLFMPIMKSKEKLPGGTKNSTPDADSTLRQIRRDEKYARKLQAFEDKVRKDRAETLLKKKRDGSHAFVESRLGPRSIVSLQENPHAQVGSQLHNRFVSAWQLVKDQRVELVFHGTPERNIDSICLNGLDPKLRKRQAYGPGEYFARYVEGSIKYCKGGNKMVVMAVLLDKSGLTADKEDVIVLNKIEHHLPLFVLTFSKKPPIQEPPQQIRIKNINIPPGAPRKLKMSR